MGDGAAAPLGFAAFAVVWAGFGLAAGAVFFVAEISTVVFVGADLAAGPFTASGFAFFFVAAFAILELPDPSRTSRPFAWAHHGL